MPFKNPDRLVVAMNGPGVAETFPLNYPQFLQWRDEFRVFGEKAVWWLGLMVSGELKAELN